MVDIHSISFKDSKSVITNPDKYISVTLDASKLLKSWSQSLYSFEWLDKDGKIKPAASLSEAEQAKRFAVEKSINAGDALIRPVLGIGMMNNIEIGSGRPVVLTLIDKGVKTIDAHIPKSCEKDFKKFRTDI